MSVPKNRMAEKTKSKTKNNKAKKAETKLNKLWAEYGKLQADREEIAQMLVKGQGHFSNLSQQMKKIYARISRLEKRKKE